MKSKKYKLRSEVWLYPGASAAWHFISIPPKQSEEIKKLFGDHARGWGSLPIVAQIGKTSWKTSIFPDKKTGAYLLPLKADVRRKENLLAGEAVTFSIVIQS